MNDAAPRPVTVAYYYKVKWGHNDEWIELFTRNHWPLLREGVRDGTFLDVRLYTPRFHGDGRADWNVKVTITYLDWSVLAEHAPRDMLSQLFPDQERYQAEEQRRFELLDAHWDVPLEEHDLPMD
jgi:hypothetical protein